MTPGFVQKKMTYKEWIDRTKIGSEFGIDEKNKKAFNLSIQYRIFRRRMKNVFTKRDDLLTKIDKKFKYVSEVDRLNAIMSPETYRDLTDALLAWIRSKQQGNLRSQNWLKDARNHSGAIKDLWSILVEGGEEDTISERRWSHQYILAVLTGFDDDTVIRAASQFVYRYRIPRDKLFFVPVGENVELSRTQRKELRIHGFRQMRDLADRTEKGLEADGDFAGVTDQDRLFIVSHGNQGGVADLLDEELASFLKGNKLSQVGVISIKSCAVGAAKYLEGLGKQLSGSGIKFKYLHGYKFSVTVTDRGHTRIAASERLLHKDWPALPDKVPLDDVDRKTVIAGPLANSQTGTTNMLT